MSAILNIDSAFDWTAEGRHIWENLDWDSYRQAAAPTIAPGQWFARRDELGLIGLVSELFIRDAYSARIEGCSENGNQDEEPEHPLFRDWRDRQLGQTERENTNIGNRRFHLTGEEPSR